jgi:hypothetical protein
MKYVHRWVQDDMFRINYIVFNPAMSKSIQQVSTKKKKFGNSWNKWVGLLDFNGVVKDVRTYVVVSYRRSTGIRYQKELYFWKWTVTKNYPLSEIW